MKKIPFAIDIKSIKEYAGLLPFSSSDLKKYQKAPFVLDAYLIGMKYSGYVGELEKAINKNGWIKDSCLKVQLKFLPMAINGLEVIMV